MRKTLDLYVIKEQIVPLSVSFFGLSFVFITGRLLQLTRYLFTSSLTVWDLMEVMAYAVPKLIVYALPMATLTGVILAFVRLNCDNELTAFKSAGVSFRQFLPPVLYVLIPVTAFSFLNTISIIPGANAAFEGKLKSLGRASIPMLLKEGTFIDTIPNLVFFFQSVDTSSLSVGGIFVQDQRRSDVKLTIVAEQAQITTQGELSELTFKLNNGIITRVSDDFKDAQAISFKSYDLTLSLDELLNSSESGTKKKNRRELTLSELYRSIREEKPRLRLLYSLEFHQRLAIPLSCLLLGLIGAPLGTIFPRKSRMTGLTLGLAVFLGYYMVLSAGKALGENGLIPVGPAIWGPNALTLAAACYLWSKAHRETPFKLASLWMDLSARIRGIRNDRSSKKNSV